MLTAWAGFGAAVLMFVLLSHATLRRFEDPVAQHALPRGVVICALLASLVSVLIVPVDVYALSYAPDYKPLVLNLYYATFGCLCFLALIAVPFAFFYSEDYANDEADEVGCVSRTASSCRMTSISLIVVLVLVLIGLLLEPGTRANLSKDGDLMHWMQNLADVHQGGVGERAMLLVVAALVVIGLLNQMLYTAFGLVSFPLMLIRGGGARDRGAALARRHDFDQLRIKHAKQAIQRKYAANQRLNRGELRKLSNLIREEKLLRSRTDWAEGDEDAGGGCASCVLTALRPFRVALGVVFLLLSLLLLASLLLTSADRAFNSKCGLMCGFTLDRPGVFNPLDKALVALSVYFPLDYAALAVVATYFFVCSVHGVVQVGVRVAGIQVYKIERGATWPQALLALALIVMLIILSLLVELMTLAPAYATFGAQGAASGASCELGGGASACAMSGLALILARITVSMPFFSALFFFGNWGFIAVMLYTLVREACRRPDPDGDYADVDVDDDFELVGLLGRRV